MKKAFYYLRCLTTKGEVHPYACVCVAEENGVISRGIAVCSPADHFSKEIGRAKALGYAIRALNPTKNIQIEKRSKIAGRIIDNILGAPVFPGVDSIKGQLKGKYLQSSTICNSNSPDCAAVPDCFISLTSLEKKLLEIG